MPVFFSSQDISFSLSNQESISSWLSQVVEQHNFKVGEINFIFCSEPYILQTNAQYLDHHYYTDVITFNYCTPRTIAGDILISIDTVRSNAEDFGVTFDDEILRVLVHGVLHLLGYKDFSDSEKKEMREAENTMLSIYETKFR